MLVLEHRAAGRSCPADYRVPDELFQGRPQLSCPVLYVAGGVYGNLWALDSLEHLVASESGAKLVLNGDYHWFDANPEVFVEIENRVAKHHALIGNIEAELRRPLGSDVGAGCGCAYPDSVYPSSCRSCIREWLHVRCPYWRRSPVTVSPWPMVMSPCWQAGPVPATVLLARIVRPSCASGCERGTYRCWP